MKTFAFKVDPLTGEEYFEVYLRGRRLAKDPLLNKLSCFTEEERQSLKLDGSLRAHVSTVAEQVTRQMLPPMEQIREVSFQVACAVARCARDSGLGRLLSDEGYAQIIRKAQWDPHYPPYRPGTPPAR
jgi:hypothetical protein